MDVGDTEVGSRQYLPTHYPEYWSLARAKGLVETPGFVSTHFIHVGSLYAVSTYDVCTTCCPVPSAQRPVLRERMSESFVGEK